MQSVPAGQSLGLHLPLSTLPTSGQPSHSPGNTGVGGLGSLGATGLISSSAGAGVGATVASAVVVPAPSFSFPPGLIPTLVEAKSRHSAMYAPLEVRDIEKAGAAGWLGGHTGGMERWWG